MNQRAWIILPALFTAPLLAAEPAKPIVPAAPPLAAGTTTPVQTSVVGDTKPAAGSVTRAAFTSAVQEREPGDSVTTLANSNTRIYYFTELKDLAGQTVTHRWEYNGKVMHEQPFEVGSARYRAFSSKTLDPLWTGEWKASVVDGSGATLSVNTFSYTQAAAPVPTAPAVAPAKAP
jgi:hypothetical protein